MESLEEEYGHDADFISEVPEYLQCVVCNLVLKDPVQIITCGHKFCSPCFARLKGHAQKSAIDLLCPVDRQVIDILSVFEDIGLKRAIGSLAVRCHYIEQGCQWSGNLDDSQFHEEKCEYNNDLQNPKFEEDDFKNLLLDLSERLLKCEAELTDKDQDIRDLRHSLKDVTDKYQKQQKQINDLHDKNAKLEKDLQIVKNEHLPKRQSLEEKVEALENTVKSTSDQSGNFLVDFVTMKGELNCLRSHHLRIDKELKELQASPGLNKSDDVSNGLMEQFKSGVDKETVVKKTQLYLHRGHPAGVVISDDNQIEFRYFSTVCAPYAVIPKGKKVFYEVTIVDVGKHCLFSRVGWATNEFGKSASCDYKGVGNCSKSYAYNGLEGTKCHNGSTPWGKLFHLDKEQQVLGVAADMVTGKLWFGLNGDWEMPMGVAFDIDTDIELFPALSGQWIEIFVNFGESDFLFGPPDSDFEKFVDVFKSQ